MKSLSYLNGIGSSSITITDDRPAGVRFDRVSPLFPVEQVLTISSTTPTVNAGINIIEIINPSTANVRYRVTINTASSPLLSGSTISWASLPTGVTLSTVGNVYTLSGIDSVAKWEAVKSFTWNLPSNYDSSPFWFLDIAILYYDGATSQEMVKSWLAYDSRFYYFAQIKTNASATTIVQKARNLNAYPSSTSSLTFSGKRLRLGNGALTASSSLSIIGQIVNTASLLARVTISASITGIRKSTASISSSASVYCLLSMLTKSMVARSYNANNANSLLTNPRISIGDPDPNTSSTFSIILTSSLGTFSQDPYVTPISPFTFSGTLTEVNNIIPFIKFYPTPESSSSGTFTYEQKKDGITSITRTVNLTGVDARFNGGNPTTAAIITSSQSWKPAAEYVKYSLYNVLLVGGGGGGSSGGGTLSQPTSSVGSGGGGGQVVQAYNVAITNQTYNIVVGEGGLGGTNASGSNGSSTSAFGLTANAGSGAIINVTNYPTINAYGGQSGSGLSGGTAQSGSNAHGGGGGGAGTVGTNYTLVGGAYYGGNGGNGIGSTIYSGTYGGGGGGVIHDPTYGGGLGGSGGGGQAAEFRSYGSDGLPNTGGGGGGGDGSVYTGQQAAGDGGSGLVAVQTYSKLPSSVTINSGQVVTTSTVVIPSTANVGDIALLFDTSTSTTDVIPTGWTSINGSTTTGIRTNISYKIITAGMAGSTITGMAGTTRKVLLIYSSNAPISSISLSSVSNQATTSTPTNQTILMANQIGVILGFAVYASTGNISTRGWTGSSPGEFNSVSTSGIYVKEIRYNFTSTTKADATITMSDGGTNTLQSFYITLY